MGAPPHLSSQQRRALDRLRTLPELGGFDLAGGAALGVHLGHRLSAVLDFFFSRTADVDLDIVKRAIMACFDVVSVRVETDLAVHLLCDGLPIDLVCYRYPLLEPPTETLGVGVAGLLDLAVMKLSAIARRGLRRDFWDLFEILHHGLDLSACGAAYVARFGVGEADLYHVLRALTYFDDAEKDPVFPPGLDTAKWEAIQAYFKREAPKAMALPRS